MRTPAKVIRDAIMAALYDLRVCAPAVVRGVTSTDPMRVDVVLGVKNKYPDGEVLDAPVLVDVPVVMPTGGQSWIRFPLVAGDTGLVIFSDRCLDDWRRGDGQPQNPTSRRAHDLSDAIFVPGLSVDSGKVNWSNTQALQMQNGQMKIVLHPTGQIEIAGGTAEMVAVLSSFFGTVTDVLDSIIYDVLVTPAGNGSHSVALATAWATAVKPLLQSYKAQLDSMKKV